MQSHRSKNCGRGARRQKWVGSADICGPAPFRPGPGVIGGDGDKLTECAKIGPFHYLSKITFTLENISRPWEWHVPLENCFGGQFPHRPVHLLCGFRWRNGPRARGPKKKKNTKLRETGSCESPVLPVLSQWVTGSTDRVREAPDGNGPGGTATSGDRHGPSTLHRMLDRDNSESWRRENSFTSVIRRGARSQLQINPAGPTATSPTNRIIRIEQHKKKNILQHDPSFEKLPLKNAHTK